MLSKLAGPERVYAEKVSSLVTDRRELKRAIDRLNSGDKLVMTKPDLLARSTKRPTQHAGLGLRQGAGFRVLDNPALDTTSAHGKLLLNILGSTAEFERELVKPQTSATS